ncbi:MAG: hypothetical protein ABSA27_10010 [Terriglobales bacterium]|jgi:hypothetical protein
MEKTKVRVLIAMIAFLTVSGLYAQPNTEAPSASGTFRVKGSKTLPE